METKISPIQAQWNLAIAEGRAFRVTHHSSKTTHLSFGCYDTAEIAARELAKWPLKSGESIAIINPATATDYDRSGYSRELARVSQ